MKRSTKLCWLAACAFSSAAVACGNTDDTETVDEAAQSVVGVPYGGSLAAVPGRIEAENYDLGGVGVAYTDTTAGNSGGAYRNDDVDIEASSQGGYNVGWTADGEWLEYTVNLANAGSYSVHFRVASLSAGGTLHLEVDGADVTAPVSFEATGG